MKSRLTSLIAIAVALIAGCASPPAQKHSASIRPGVYYKDDGPPSAVTGEFERIADAQPRDEPLHRFANRQYNVFGVNYTPMTTLAPLRQRGMASWYGKKFHGQKTAIGETYDMFAMTAAHPTAPLPSFARITGVRSGKSVVVRINDRGPFHAGRIVDLSYAAAHRIGLVQAGSGEVAFELLLPPHFGSNSSLSADLSASDANSRRSSPDLGDIQGVSAPSASAIFNGTMRQFFVQLGAFGNFNTAQAFQVRMTGELGTQPAVRHVDNLFRVQLGPFSTMNDAQAAQSAAQQRVGSALPIVTENVKP